MIDPSLWAGLNVQEFFSGYNWQGYPPETHLTQPAEHTVEQVSWMSLSVQEFLQQNNWKGISSSYPTPVALSFSLKVSEFFQLIAWEDGPKIAALPKDTFVPEPTAPTFQDLKFTDLSDLF